MQLLYIATLLGFAAFGAYLVVRQVLIRRDLEEAAKVLGERIRSGDGNSEVSHPSTLNLAVTNAAIDSAHMQLEDMCRIAMSWG